jgi:hypothetical protein
VRTIRIRLRPGLWDVERRCRGRFNAFPGGRACSRLPDRYSHTRDGNSLEGADGPATNSLRMKAATPPANLTRGPPEERIQDSAEAVYPR